MNFEKSEDAFVAAGAMQSARYKGEKDLGLDPKDDALFPKLEHCSDLVALLWYHAIGGK